MVYIIGLFIAGAIFNWSFDKMDKKGFDSPWLRSKAKTDSIVFAVVWPFILLAILFGLIGTIIWILKWALRISMARQENPLLLNKRKPF